MYKKFGIQVEEDVVEWQNIAINPETGLPDNNNDLLSYNALMNTKIIIDCSNLTYLPTAGSTWDGLNFYKDGTISKLPIKEDIGLEYHKFIFLDQDKVVQSVAMYKKDRNFESPTTERNVAMLSSNPKVIDMGVFND